MEEEQMANVLLFKKMLCNYMFGGEKVSDRPTDFLLKGIQLLNYSVTFNNSVTAPIQPFSHWDGKNN